MNKDFGLKVCVGIVLFYCSITKSFAQSLPGFGDDVNDEVPAAPIDFYILVGISVGVLFGMFILKYLKQGKYEK